MGDLTLYNKGELQALGASLENLLAGIRRDGVGADEFTNLTQTFIAAAKTVNEMRDVPGAAIPHTLGAALDKYGDRELAEAVAAQTPDTPPE